MSTPIALVVGLGNPGAEYASTRHNVGFWVCDLLAKAHGASFRADSKFSGDICRLRLDEGDLWLLKPMTYMNRSGISVSAMAHYYKIEPEAILVVHDELDLLPGLMKLKLGGGNAGHNGLKDITAQLGTPNFWRLRIGIGHPRHFGWEQAVADYVLSNPNALHRDAMTGPLESAVKLIPWLVEGNFQRALRQVSKHQKSPLTPEKPKVESSETPSSTTQTPSTPDVK